MRISDWSSDVCSSDLAAGANVEVGALLGRIGDGAGAPAKKPEPKKPEPEKPDPEKAEATTDTDKPRQQTAAGAEPAKPDAQPRSGSTAQPHAITVPTPGQPGTQSHAHNPQHVPVGRRVEGSD